MKNYRPVNQLEMTSVLVQFPDQNSAIVTNADQLQTIAVEHRHIQQFTRKKIPRYLTKALNG
jgi:hypothetical protein